MFRLEDINEDVSSYGNHNQAYTVRYRQLQYTKLLCTSKWLDQLTWNFKFTTLVWWFFKRKRKLNFKKIGPCHFIEISLAGTTLFSFFSLQTYLPFSCGGQTWPFQQNNLPVSWLLYPLHVVWEEFLVQLVVPADNCVCQQCKINKITMKIKGPYADHILIPQGSTASIFFDIKWKPIFFWFQIQNFSFKFFVVLEI